MAFTQKKKRELARIRKFISRAEKRGFRFSEDLKKDLPTWHTNKLKALTPDKLYNKATALNESGRIISGQERRREERKEAARRAQKTRKLQKLGDIIKRNVGEMVETYDTAGSNYLKSLLANEVKQFGEIKVLRALGNSPEEAIAAAQTIIFYNSNKTAHHRELVKFAELIKGYIQPEEELKTIGRIQDKL